MDLSLTHLIILQRDSLSLTLFLLFFLQDDYPLTFVMTRRPWPITSSELFQTETLFPPLSRAAYSRRKNADSECGHRVSAGVL